MRTANPARRSFILLLLLALCGAAPSSAQKEKDKKAAERARHEADKWVEQTLKKMSLDEKIGQLLLVSYFGGFTSTESPEYQNLIEQIDKRHVGGFIVRTRGNAISFDRSQVYPTAALANQLQRRSKLPLLIASDFERGTAMRLDEGTSFPYPMAVAAAGKPEDAYTVGKITALEARAAGVQWVFAPVADVNNNADNPIINTRSFGEDPRRVADFVAAFTRGVEENGALATAKHFPGHGDTSTDSHLDLPTVKGDRVRIESVELPPFRAAFAAGASTVMTGHLAVTALEPDPDIPATLSPRILSELLRREMNFDGIVVTDAMDMGGVTVRYPPAEAAVRSILAGADMLLIPPVVDSALAGLKAAAASGRLSVARIEESVRRILRAKAKLGLNRERLVDLNALNSAFHRPEFAAAAQDIADRGITLLRNDAGLLPLDAARPTRALLLSVAGDPAPVPGEHFEREIRWRVDSLQVVRTDTRFNRAEYVKLPPQQNYDLAIVALYVAVSDRKGTVGLPAAQADLINQLLNSAKPVVVIGFGSPYLIANFPNARTWLAAFSTFDVVQRSAARALFGQIPTAGHIPVSIPGVAKIGDGLSVPANAMKLRAASPEMEAKLASAYKLLDAGVADHAFPGGVLAVGFRGELAVHPFGRFTYDAKSPAVAADTLYDLASVTKHVVTATAVQMLIAAGRLSLDARLVTYVPEFASGPQPEWRSKVTIRHLLTYTSGLPALPEDPGNRRSPAEIRQWLLTEALAFEPGSKQEFSGVGFWLLGEVVERLTGQRLDTVAQERIFGPLGMPRTMYNPPPALRPAAAPSVEDKTVRKRLLQGETMDTPSWILGGVSGSNSLFSTAPDLAIFAQTLLNGGIYAHQRILRRNQIEQMTVPPASGDQVHGLGWAAAAAPANGRYWSPRGFGYSGSSGTSLWVDPEKDLFIILLTNRIYPDREKWKIESLRPALHDSIFGSLGLTP